MTREEFESLINDDDFLLAQYLVNIRLKFSENEEWEYTNEVLDVNDGKFEWLNDWYEGQKYVEFLGYILIDDIVIPNNLNRRRYTRWHRNQITKGDTNDDT